MSDSPFIIDVSEADFAEAVIDNSLRVPVLLDFWAPWCGPCRSLIPVLVKLAEEYAGKFILAKVNIDEEQGLAMAHGVRSVPTVKVYRRGQVVDEFMGAQSEGMVRALLERHVERPSDRLRLEAAERLAGGDDAAALALLRQARELDPGNHRVLLDLARLLAATGEVAEGEELLRGLPLDKAAEPEVEELKAGMELARALGGAPGRAELEAAVAADPADSRSRHRLAARQALAGEYEAALESLLELLRRDRGYGNGAARAGMLAIFTLLGGQGPLVQRYRSRMFNLLH